MSYQHESFNIWQNGTYKGLEYIAKCMDMVYHNNYGNSYYLNYGDMSEYNKIGIAVSGVNSSPTFNVGNSSAQCMHLNSSTPYLHIIKTGKVILYGAGKTADNADFYGIIRCKCRDLSNPSVYYDCILGNPISSSGVGTYVVSKLFSYKSSYCMNSTKFIGKYDSPSTFTGDTVVLIPAVAITDDTISVSIDGLYTVGLYPKTGVGYDRIMKQVFTINGDKYIAIKNTGNYTNEDCPMFAVKL